MNAFADLIESAESCSSVFFFVHNGREEAGNQEEVFVLFVRTVEKKMISSKFSIRQVVELS